MAEILLVVVVTLLLALIALGFLVYRGKRIQAYDIEPAMSKGWRESGLDETVGRLTAHTSEIKESYRTLEQMLRVPKERGSLGEMSLETILSDQLPPDMFGMRERVLDGKAPDAHIKSTGGLICIDSKFPLDNYMEMINAQESKESDGHRRRFINDVRGHLDKISSDYVCPDKGSAEFAFAYIPSEAVYYFLVCEAYQLLRDYTSKGVQVASPLTLSHKVELIKTGVHAKKLSGNAESVKNDIIKLSRQFESVDKTWQVLYTHLKNAANKAEELDQEYKRLREEFDRISKIA